MCTYFDLAKYELFTTNPFYGELIIILNNTNSLI